MRDFFGHNPLSQLKRVKAAKIRKFWRKKITQQKVSFDQGALVLEFDKRLHNITSEKLNIYDRIIWFHGDNEINTNSGTGFGDLFAPKVLP